MNTNCRRGAKSDDVFGARKKREMNVNIVTKTCLISGDEKERKKERATAEPNLYNLSHSLNAAVDMFGYILLVAYVRPYIYAFLFSCMSECVCARV